MYRTIRVWVGIAILGLVALFTVQNVASVEVTLILWTVTLPRAILVLVVFAAGLLTGWILRAAHRPRGMS